MTNTCRHPSPAGPMQQELRQGRRKRAQAFNTVTPRVRSVGALPPVIVLMCVVVCMDIFCSVLLCYLCVVALISYCSCCGFQNDEHMSTPVTSRSHATRTKARPKETGSSVQHRHTKSAKRGRSPPSDSVNVRCCMYGHIL